MNEMKSMKPIRSFSELRKLIKDSEKTVVAVPIAEDEVSLSVAIEAGRQKVANFLLIGNRERIKETLSKEVDANLLDYEIIPEEDPVKAAEMAVQLARERKADIIMKGHIQTYQLMKAVLNSENGLRTDRLLSDVFLFEDPRPDGGKITAITDGGVTILPDLTQKKQIIENAVEVYHALGHPNPKVALLCAVEVVSTAMQATVDARDLVEMWKKGEIRGCQLGGPFALDNAISKWCAEVKGITSEVAGDADILIAPNIEAGNMLAKSVVYYSGARLGHVIMGARVPVLINSRVDDTDAKMNSILLGIIMSRK